MEAGRRVALNQSENEPQGAQGRVAVGARAMSEVAQALKISRSIVRPLAGMSEERYSSPLHPSGAHNPSCTWLPYWYLSRKAKFESHAGHHEQKRRLGNRIVLLVKEARIIFGRFRLTYSFNLYQTYDIDQSHSLLTITVFECSPNVS